MSDPMRIMDEIEAKRPLATRSEEWKCLRKAVEQGFEVQKEIEAQALERFAERLYRDRVNHDDPDPYGFAAYQARLEADRIRSQLNDARRTDE